MLYGKKGFFAAALMLCFSGVLHAGQVRTLNVYTTIPDKFVMPLFQRFTEQTGIKVNSLRLSSGELLARVLAEQKRPQADVAFGGPADVYDAAKTAGALQTALPAGWDRIPPAYRDADGAWFGMGVMPMCFLFNRNVAAEKKAKMPDSWPDLLDPAFKGSLQMADARTSGTASERIYSLVKIYGEDGAFEFQKKLNANVQMYTKSGAGGALPIAMGQAAGGVFYYVDVMELKLAGYPVEVIFPREGVTYSAECTALLKGASHPDEAKAFIDWVASDDFVMTRLDQRPYYLAVQPELRALNRLIDLKTVKLIDADCRWKSENRSRFIERWIREIAQTKSR